MIAESVFMKIARTAGPSFMSDAEFPGHPAVAACPSGSESLFLQRFGTILGSVWAMWVRGLQPSC